VNAWTRPSSRPVRRALEAYGDVALTDFGPFKAAYAALTEKLRPLVYELGFLPT